MGWLTHLQTEHNSRHKQNLWRNRQVLHSPQQANVSFDGSVTLLNFSSNDYLGLANHQELVHAMQKAATAWGAGSGASHLVSGHQTPHHELELELADFVGAKKALLFSTGYMANLAVPSAFLGRNDAIVQDKLNHASLLEGGWLSQAVLKRYRHADVQHAGKIMQQVKSAVTNTEKLMLSTDGVFSMDGDIAPLPELKKLCDKHDALFLIDDAHGLGVIGQQGKGSAEVHHLPVAENVLLLGTLGKAFGSFGAFVAGDEILIEHLVQYARPYIYTTALPAPVAEASRAALSIIREESWRRDKLTQHIDQFRRGAEQLGLNIMSSNTPIQPLLIGEETAAIKLSEYLQSNGFYITAIRPPTVPAGSARLRITFSAGHESEHIKKLLDCFDSQEVRQILRESQVDNGAGN